MPSKLSNLVDNLSEINNQDCKKCIERKNVKSPGADLEEVT